MYVRVHLLYVCTYTCILHTTVKQYKLHFLAHFHYMSLCFMSCRGCAKEGDHEKTLADLTAHEDEHLGGYR